MNGYAQSRKNYKRVLEGAKWVGVTGTAFSLALAGKHVKDACGIL